MRRESSLKLLRVAQLLAWASSTALWHKTTAESAPSFASLAALSAYAYSFISTMYVLFESNKPSTTVIVQTQFSTFAALLICYSENIFAIGAGLIFYSTLSWLVYSNELHKKPAEKLFRSQILADLCIIFGLLILTMTVGITFATGTKWIFLAELLFFTGLFAKIVSFITITSIYPSSSIFTHKGLFIVAIILFVRDASFLKNEYYNVALLCLSNAGFVWFNIDALLTSNIRKSASLLNFGGTSFILFLHCLCDSDITKHIFLACFFIQGGISLLAEIVIRIMSGELNIKRMGGIRKHAPITFAITVLTFVIAIFMMMGNNILLPYLSAMQSSPNNLFKTFAIANYAFFIITYCFWMIRFMFFVFLGKNRSSEQVFAYVREVHWGMKFPAIACLVCASMFLIGNLPHELELDQARGFSKNSSTSMTPILISGICSLYALSLHVLKTRKSLTAITLLSHELFENVKTFIISRSAAYGYSMLKNIASFSPKILSSAYRKASLFFLEKLYADSTAATIISLLVIVILLLCCETLSSI
jgi:NADH:ubiquinone oxidoreductase subunit 5 (subunit L)/multisubunit Na+/H+ antiporter MnhA subunit